MKPLGPMYSGAAALGYVVIFSVLLVLRIASAVNAEPISVLVAQPYDPQRTSAKGEARYDVDKVLIDPRLPNDNSIGSRWGWRVTEMREDSNTQVYHATFSGPDAELRANEYAAWKRLFIQRVWKDVPKKLGTYSDGEWRWFKHKKTGEKRVEFLKTNSSGEWSCQYIADVSEWWLGPKVEEP